MITALNNVNLQINIEVKFKVHSLTDKQTWRGKVVGIGGFDVASQYSDVYATHNNMEADVARKEPVSLTYLIVKTTDGQIRPFAAEWIIENTFTRTDIVADANLIIHNVSDAEKAKVLTAIRDLGFEVSVVA